MSEEVRPRVSPELVEKTRKAVNFPDSTNFNDSLNELLKRYRKLTESKK